MTLKNLLPALIVALASTAHAQTVTLAAPGQPDSVMTALQLQALPTADATLTFGNPPTPHHFHGPLLWTVLTTGHLIDPAHHSDVVRQTLRIQGSDSYVAILAMGELSPDFEAKPALLALTMDDKSLEHPRVVLPGDHRAGRSVRDVVSLTLTELPKP